MTARYLALGLQAISTHIIKSRLSINTYPQP